MVLPSVCGVKEKGFAAVKLRAYIAPLWIAGLFHCALMQGLLYWIYEINTKTHLDRAHYYYCFDYYHSCRVLRACACKRKDRDAADKRAKRRTIAGNFRCFYLNLHFSFRKHNSSNASALRRQHE
jgi:hypothetical protein